MKRIIFLLFFLILSSYIFSETIDVLINGVDDGVKVSKQQDYMEALMNAKLQAIERAGVEISSITRIENFKLKYDAVESKAEATLMPGFQVIDMGYQQDGTYQVVLAGKVRSGDDLFAIDSSQFLTIKEKLIPLLTNDRNVVRIRDRFENFCGTKFTIPEEVRKMDLILKLLPEDFDYSSDEMIRKARVHVLGLTLLRELPKLPRGKVQGLTFRKGKKGVKNPRDVIIGFLGFTDGSTEQWEAELYGRWYHPDLGWRDSGTIEQAKEKLKQQFDQSDIQQRYEMEFRKEQEKYINQIQPFLSTVRELERLDEEGYWKQFLNRIQGKI